MISIILPTYNEAKNILKLMEDLRFNLKDRKYEIIVVDDNSQDNTAKVVLGMKKRFPVKVIMRGSKLGLSSAVIAGINSAKGDMICVMDADLSHPASLIPKLIRAVESGSDLVIGSRLVKDGGVENWPFHRKLISWFATLLAMPLTRVKDPMSGFFLFKKEILVNAKLNPLSYKILLEILVKGKQKKVKEIPYMFRNREMGKSKIGFRVYFDYLRHIFRLYHYKLFA
jgi:dolichol-phosphate mannosyltransferase